MDLFPEERLEPATAGPESGTTCPHRIIHVDFGQVSLSYRIKSEHNSRIIDVPEDEQVTAFSNAAETPGAIRALPHNYLEKNVPGERASPIQFRRHMNHRLFL